MSNLRLVILDSAYAKWKSKQIRNFYCDLVQLKYDAYRVYHREGILAVSDSDQIAIHKIICEEKNGNLTPLLGNYTITTSRSKFHNLDFPALSLVRSSKSESHISAMSEIIDHCQINSMELGYDAGYAINPNLKVDHVLLRDIFKGIKPIFSQYYGIQENITAATVRFKVEKICEFWGYKAISLNDKPLPTIFLPRFDNLEVLVMHLSAYTKEALEFSAGFKAMWDSRIELLGPAALKLAA